MTHFALESRNLMPEYVAHSHDFHQLILATCGATDLAMEGQGNRVTAQRGCLIPASRRHEYEGDGQNHTLVLDVPVAHLAGLERGDSIERLFDAPRFFSVPTALGQLTKALALQLEQCPLLQQDIATLLLRALYVYLEQAPTSLVPRLMVRNPSERLDLLRLDAWVDHHLADDICVEQMAALCALSPGHFHSCFRERTGLTPLAYVQRRRLEHAQMLVKHSSLTLAHIAQRIGFRDQGSFSRAYRRHFERTPSSERQ